MTQTVGFRCLENHINNYAKFTESKTRLQAVFPD